MLRSSFLPQLNVQGPSWYLPLQADPQLQLSLPSPRIHSSSLKLLQKKILPIPDTLHFMCYEESKTPGYCCSVFFKENFFLVAATECNLYHSRTAALLLPGICGWTSQQWLLGITWGSTPSSIAFLHQCPTRKVEMTHRNSAALGLAVLSHLRSKLAQLLPEVSLLSMAILKANKTKLKHQIGTDRNMQCNCDCNRKLVVGSLEVYIES